MGRPRHSTSVGFWEALQLYPPLIVRLAARRIVTGKNVCALSNSELAIITGIPLSRIMEISLSHSWDDITLGEAHKFCEACNFDPTVSAHRERQRDYIRSCQTRPNKPPHYLRSSPWWESQFLPLIQSLRTSPMYSTALVTSSSPPLSATSAA